MFAAVSHDAGETFSPPVRVSDGTGEARVGSEQPPRAAIHRTSDGAAEIVVVWGSKHESGSRLLAARSLDGGRTFGRGDSVPGTEAPGNRGWATIAAAPNGRVFTAWLDHRDGAPRAGAPMQQHRHGSGAAAPATDGVARAQLSQLYTGSLDGVVPAHGIARGVCYCCKTALLSPGDGVIYAAWRHVYPGNRRDIAFAASRDDGRTFSDPIRVSEDNWQLDGCPENGPALALDRQQRIHVVWPTLVGSGNEETLALFHAVSEDGRAFTPRTRIPTTGAAYHPVAAMAADGTLVVAWDESAGGQRRVKLARGRPGSAGAVSFEPIAIERGDGGISPTLATTAEATIVAWTRRADTGSTIVVTRIK